MEVSYFVLKHLFFYNLKAFNELFITCMYIFLVRSGLCVVCNCIFVHLKNLSIQISFEKNDPDVFCIGHLNSKMFFVHDE